MADDYISSTYFAILFSRLSSFSKEVFSQIQAFFHSIYIPVHQLMRYCCGCCGDGDVIDIHLEKNMEEIEFGTYLVKSDENKNEGGFVNTAYNGVRNIDFIIRVSDQRD